MGTVRRYTAGTMVKRTAERLLQECCGNGAERLREHGGHSADKMRSSIFT